MAAHIGSAWVKFKSKLSVVYNQSTLALALRDSSAEDWKLSKQNAFDKTKKVSDFIGILTRAGFVWLCVLYFSSASEHASSWLESKSFGLCAVLSLGLYVFLLFEIQRIIFLFWISDSTKWRWTSGKFWVVISSALQTILATYGISSLAGAIAHASKLVP